MLLHQLAPLLMFMLIPVWIPLVTSTVGLLVDVVRAQLGHRPALTPAEQLKARRARVALPEGA